MLPPLDSSLSHMHTRFLTHSLAHSISLTFMRPVTWATRMHSLAEQGNAQCRARGDYGHTLHGLSLRRALLRVVTFTLQQDAERRQLLQVGHASWTITLSKWNLRGACDTLSRVAWLH